MTTWFNLDRLKIKKLWIKYAEMFAKITPVFKRTDIPWYGKSESNVFFIPWYKANLMTI